MIKGYRQLKIKKAEFREQVEPKEAKIQVGDKLSRFKDEREQEANAPCRYSATRKVA